MKKLYYKYGEIINYIIFGILTTLVSLFVYYGLTYTVLNTNNPIELQIANIVSWVAAVTFAYFTNRTYVFKKKNKANIKEALEFFLSRISTLLIDMFFMYLFVTRLNFNDKVIKIVVQVIVIILNYIFSKLFVFKKK